MVTVPGTRGGETKSFSFKVILTQWGRQSEGQSKQGWWRGKDHSGGLYFLPQNLDKRTVSWMWCWNLKRQVELAVHGYIGKKNAKMKEEYKWEHGDLGKSGSSAGKESTCNAGDPSLIPGTGRSSGEGIGYPLQYSWASLVTQSVKEPACSLGDLGSILG